MHHAILNFGGIDILISNAGNATSGLMLELDDKKLRKAFELNFFAHKSFAVEAAKTSADIIVLCGVHFMAETAKLMSPDKKVLIPDMNAGCSLAASLTGEDVRLLKKQYPGVPVVSYVNTSADVKAETDVCCTSANAVKVVESL